MIAIADTSFIIAVSIQSDRHHAEYVKVYNQHRKILVLEAALAEVAFMLRRSGGDRAVFHFLRGLPNAKRYEVV